METSFNNSIEIGTWLTNGTPEYQMLVRFLGEEIKPSLEKVAAQPAPGKPAPVATKKPPSRAGLPSSDEEGFCIRCGDELDYNPDRPLCREDYSVWERYKDPTYRENYCHACGEPSNTSMAKPLCLDCFRDR